MRQKSHAIALMFALARQLPEASAQTQAGLWPKNGFMGVEVTGKALGLAAPSAAAAAAAETLPPPLFPERSLRPFRWWDPEKRDIWLLQKAEELSEALAASPYNLDAPPSAEALLALTQQIKARIALAELELAY
jgi:hypothetical protein